MSRSRRHTPIVGICGGGAGYYRAYRAGQERTRLRSCLASGKYAETERELAPWDEWKTDRDGKRWLGDQCHEGKRK